MSAINILIQSNSVHILTDGTVFHPDGKLIMIGPKAVCLPHLNCAIAFRGAAGAKMMLSEVIAFGAPTFDGLRQTIAELLKSQAEQFSEAFQLCTSGPEFEVVVAGISETAGPTAYIVNSHGRYGKSWTPIELAGFVPLPCDEVTLAKMQRIIPPGTSPDDIDPERDGLAVMKLQRATPRLSNGDFCPVGAFAQLTTVTRNSVSTRIIHRWPDVIGEEIGSTSVAA